MLERIEARSGLRLRTRFGRALARRVGRRSLDPARPVEAGRKALDRGSALVKPPKAAALSHHILAERPCARWTPPEPRPGALLYLHGGGFSRGSAKSHGPFAARLSLAFDLETHLPDYRLAPEHRFPAAFEDARAAFAKLAGAGRGPVVIAGDSAGGGLALAVAADALRSGTAAPAALYLISPWLDLSMAGGSMESRAAADPMLTPDALHAAAELYLKDGDRFSAEASPLFADLAGLPPTLIQVGDDEVLLDDALRLEAKLAEVGVDSLCQVWDGLWHDFPLFAPMLPEGNRAIEEAAAWLGPHLDAARG